ncbi:MAG TPA: ribbon-helix-helix domain-containing protein [Candidatus Nanoarchaeia archaeon]|nr:ribbon-helix-helix domain-containing protein [Candidatus Nanoarchaeia archaeon]
MEVISLKMEDGLIDEIDDKLAKHRYATRSEFIRDAIREKLSDLEKEDILKELAKLRGSSKRKTTDEQLHLARERAAKLLESKFT